jgi:hypothetical protein
MGNIASTQTGRLPARGPITASSRLRVFSNVGLKADLHGCHATM